MPKGQESNEGPKQPETVYIPGTPGGQWTPEEVDSTRQRILLMTSPLWLVQMAMGQFDKSKGGPNHLLQ